MRRGRRRSPTRTAAQWPKRGCTSRRPGPPSFSPGARPSGGSGRPRPLPSSRRSASDNRRPHEAGGDGPLGERQSPALPPVRYPRGLRPRLPKGVAPQGRRIRIPRSSPAGTGRSPLGRSAAKRRSQQRPPTCGSPFLAQLARSRLRSRSGRPAAGGTNAVPPVFVFAPDPIEWTGYAASPPRSRVCGYMSVGSSTD
jgi:hypothetical protein